ncbi:MFS transporter [Niastella caeni]|uniref:MFS transporter n=1 Tax=Niastella caeni TaxID=2569763 RepID=A0A4S8I0N5_9BACT|nr:MFS transporter [Niastella caeni]THU41435.1 MFS transporter [Niastella caeni]
MRIITRTVWILSLVSLFADVASEMLYPIIPLYLQQIGFSVAWIGLLEGVAGFTAGISKGYFGKLSDEKGLRLPFVKTGYFFSALSKPMLAVATFKMWIFFARTLDRLGKGIRTAARDALLSKEATRQTKARIFGFHRSMDTLGAVLGPIIALTWLFYNPGGYASIFYLAFIPGLLSVVLIFLLKEQKQPASTLTAGNFFSFFSYWKIATPAYKRLVIGLTLFAIANSSDVFLLLKAKQIGQNDNTAIIAYILYNIVYAVSAYPMGIVADKTGKKKVYLFGLMLFAVVYGGFAFATSSLAVYVLFFVYGIYAATTEGIAKAWITNMAHDQNTATAIGFYTSMESVSSLLASIIAGVLWSGAGSGYVFFFSTALAFVVILYLWKTKEV